jgi:hypothetical protein
MTVDFLRRGRWTLPSLALGVNFFPLLLLTALGSHGAIDASDPGHIIMHIVLTQVNMWMFGVAVISSQGPVSKLFALPVTAATIVLWRMSMLVILATVQCVLSTLLINSLFDVDWPLWGPALLLAISLAAAQAIVWYADKSIWVVPMLSLLALGYGGWMKSHYGGMFQQPDHYWRQVTLADAGQMLVMLALAYWLGVAGVARMRRGELPLSLGIVDWLWGLMGQGRFRAAAPFPSPTAAQFWHEWRKKGWAMPAGAGFGLLLALAGWLLFNRNPNDLWEALFALGGCLTILALIGGLILGNSGMRGDDFALGSFLATRPLTTTTLANILLKACGASVLLAWLLWAVAFGLAFAILTATRAAPVPLLPGKLHWSYYPGTLLGPWIVVTLVASVGLTGRLPRFIVAGACLFAGWIAMTIFSGYALSPQGQDLLNQAVVTVLGIGCLLGTLAAFLAAWRRRLIRWPVVYVCGTLWAALTFAALFGLARYPFTSLQLLVIGTLASGLLALAVAPLATAPLAMAWNRTR